MLHNHQLTFEFAAKIINKSNIARSNENNSLFLLLIGIMFMKNLLLWGLLGVLTACHSSKTPFNSTSDSAQTAREEVAIDTIATLVSKVQQQSKLFAADCKVHKVVLFTDQSQIDGGLVKFKKVGHRKNSNSY